MKQETKRNILKDFENETKNRLIVTLNFTPKRQAKSKQTVAVHFMLFRQSFPI